MQRNLGANAGLDYRELADILAAISRREEDALTALCGGGAEGAGGTAGPPDSACSQGLTPAVDAAAEAVPRGSSHDSAVKGEAHVTAHVGARGRVHVESPQAPPAEGNGAHVQWSGLPGQHPPSMSPTGCDGNPESVCSVGVCEESVAGLWRRRDAVDVVLRRVRGTEQQAAALQHLLNLRRAGLILLELERMSDIG